MRHPSQYAVATAPTTLNFKSGDSGKGLLNPTKEGAIIAHEYMHLFTHWHNDNFDTGRIEHENVAMWESYSDFAGLAYRLSQGCSGSGCPTIGIYADTNPVNNLNRFKRTIGISAHYNQYWTNSPGTGEDFDDNTKLNHYDNSFIFSGALWDYRDDVSDPFDAEFHVVESLHYLWGTVDFLDGKDALWIAASIGCSNCRPLVCSNFDSRGIVGGSQCQGGSKRGAEPETARAASAVPEAYALRGNYPNPFNPQTTIRFGLPEATAVTLVVYDVLGRQVRVLVDGTRAAGTHEVVFEAGNLPSGTYFYQMTTDGFMQTRKLILLK